MADYKVSILHFWARYELVYSQYISFYSFWRKPILNVEPLVNNLLEETIVSAGWPVFAVV